MRQPATPLGQIFGNSDALSRLSEHAALLLRVQRIVDTQLPRLMQAVVGVANCREGALILHVPSPALASRLKMGMDSLRAALRDQGLAIEDITVRVRPVQCAPGSHLYANQNRSLGAGGREAFGVLGRQIGADTPLAQAIERLLKHAK